MKNKIYFTLIVLLFSFNLNSQETFNVTLQNGAIISKGYSGFISCGWSTGATFSTTVTYNAAIIYNIRFELFHNGNLIQSQTIATNASGVCTHQISKHLSPGNYSMRVKKGNNQTYDLGNISITQVPDYYGFGSGSNWSSQFVGSDGFSQTNGTLRLTGDVNGDNKDDIIGFGSNNVSVGISNGSSFNGKSIWHTGWSSAQGWNYSDYSRKIGDVNGDGKDDIVGFGYDGVYVSLSTGSSFGTGSVKWNSGWGVTNGWNNSNGLQREIADVDGDGKDDIVGFTTSGTWVALSNGTSFQPATNWNTGWGPNVGWGLNGTKRVLADVNGDGRKDIVGFTSNGVYVSLSNGTSFLSSTLWTSGFSNNFGWNNINFGRFLGDINGDGNDDIIGFGNDAVYVSISNGASMFGQAQIWVTGYDVLYGYGALAPHIIGDFNGDHLTDIGGLSSVITISLSNGQYGCTPWFLRPYQSNNESNLDLDTEIEPKINSEDTEIILYPNPSNGIITIKGINPDKIHDIFVYDIRGIIVEKISSNPFMEIDLQNLEAGQYHLVISSENTQIVKKITKL